MDLSLETEDVGNQVSYGQLTPRSKIRALLGPGLENRTDKSEETAVHTQEQSSELYRRTRDALFKESRHLAKAAAAGSSAANLADEHADAAQERQSPAQEARPAALENSYDRLHGSDDDSGEEDEDGYQKRLQALVEARLAQRRQQDEEASSYSMPERHDDDDDDDDDGSARVDSMLTQKSAPQSARRPPADSRAVYERLHRETERLTRDMALAPKAFVKKTFTVADFMAKFMHGAKSTGAGKREDDDKEDAEKEEERGRNEEVETEGQAGRDGDMESNTLHKAEVAKVPSPLQREREADKTAIKLQESPTRLRHPDTRNTPAMQQTDSDSDLDIVDSPKLTLDAFLERHPARQASIKRNEIRLRALAHVNRSPERGISIKRLNRELLRDSATRNKLARQERLEELKANGIDIDEIIQRNQKKLQDGSDLLEKAQLEAEEILRLERERRAHDRKKTALLESDDEQDDDYDDDEDGDEDEGAAGDSDDEMAQGQRNGESDDELDDSGSDTASSSIITPASSAEASDEADKAIGHDGHAGHDGHDGHEDEPSAMLPPKSKPRRRARVVHDYDSEDEIVPEPDENLSELDKLFSSSTGEPEISPSKRLDLLRTAKSISSKEDLNNDTGSALAVLEDAGVDTDLHDSQQRSSQRDSQLSQLSPDVVFRPNPVFEELRNAEPTLTQDVSATQETFQDVSQDGEMPASMQRLKRLVHKNKFDRDQQESAFNMVLRQSRATYTAAEIEHMRRGFLEEQAEESEDEYAGLGGASDDSDEDNDEDIRELQAIINDENTEDLGEEGIAALHRQMELDRDDKHLKELWKGIGNGTLKRGRGLGMLSDEEDEDEEERRRRQRQRALRQRLLDDENLSRLDNPKNLSFLKTVEDTAHGSECLIKLDDADSGLGSSSPRATSGDEEQPPQPPAKDYAANFTRLCAFLSQDSASRPEGVPASESDDEDGADGEAELRRKLDACITRSRSSIHATSSDHVVLSQFSKRLHAAAPTAAAPVRTAADTRGRGTAVSLKPRSSPAFTKSYSTHGVAVTRRQPRTLAPSPSAHPPPRASRSRDGDVRRRSVIQGLE